MICSKCGSQISKGKNFCDKCGTPVKAVSRDADFACPQCGTPAKLTYKFCKKCGADLKTFTPSQVMSPMTKEEKKLNYEDFFLKAILRLRDTSKSPGIHSVFSGFNQAFRAYYFGEDPVKVQKELASNGKIEIRPVKGGVMIYLPGEAPKSRADMGKTALSKILREPPEHDKS